MNRSTISTPFSTLALSRGRRTRAGNVHGADQAISLDHALRAHTIDAARTLDLPFITEVVLAEHINPKDVFRAVVNFGVTSGF